MDGVIIAWTPTNWATVFLMALGGFLFARLLFIGIQKARAANA